MERELCEIEAMLRLVLLTDSARQAGTHALKELLAAVVHERCAHVPPAQPPA
jgi:hypothetical protein